MRFRRAGRVVVADLDQRHLSPEWMPANVRPSTVEDAVLHAEVVVAAVERLGVRLADEHVAVNVVVVVGVIDAVGRPVDAHVLDQHARHLRAEGVMHRPRSSVLRMMNGWRVSGPTRSTPSPRLTPYRPSQWASLSSKRTNGNVRMSTALAVPSGCWIGNVSLKATASAWPRSGSRSGRSRGDVAREGVQAVGPPEAGTLVGVERQHLLGQRLAARACTARLRSRTL